MHFRLRGASVCLLAAALVVILVGCGQQPVAIVNGQKITRAEFVDRLKQAAGKPVLVDLIFRRLVEDAFARAGLKVTDEEVQQRIEELMREFPTEEAFRQWLASMGMTPQDLPNEMKFQIKLEKLRAKDVKYTEADLKRYFQEHRDKYDKPLRVVISQIVVSSKAEADKIYKELNKPGSDFGALARQYSIDAMFRSRGGRLPEVPLDNLLPEMRAVVSKMKPGDVSKPVNVNDNWYIIKLIDRKPAEKATFEKVRKRVERDFLTVSGKPQSVLYKDLARQAVVQVLDPDLAEVQEMFVPRGQLPSFGEREAPAGGEKAKPGAKKAKPAKPPGKTAPGGEKKQPQGGSGPAGH